VGAATPGTRPRDRGVVRGSPGPRDVGLGGALRAAAAGDDGVVAWWHRPRTQRWLGWLETTAAAAVLALLAGVLGVYDAGARL